MIYIDFVHVPSGALVARGPFVSARVIYGELWAESAGDTEPKLIAVKAVDTSDSAGLWCDAYGREFTDLVIYHKES